ncbi:MAG: hypothetical protein WA890_31140 [Micromonospora sp.]
MGETSAELLAVNVLAGRKLRRPGDRMDGDAFCASRLAGDHGHAYGTLPSGVDFAAIIARATPKVG